jgi:hypothetical protein
MKTNSIPEQKKKKRRRRRRRETLETAGNVEGSGLE